MLLSRLLLAGAAMKKRLLLLLLMAAACSGQAPVQYQQVFNGVSAATNSNPVQNIGQSTHTLVVGLRNSPGHTCVAASTALLSSIQASGDQTSTPTNWFTPPSSISTMPVPNASGSVYVKTKEVRTTGSYPWVRATVGGFDTTNCVADGFYFGSQQAVHLAQQINGSSANPSTAGNTVLLTNSGSDIQGNVLLMGLVVYNVTAGQTLKIPNGGGGNILQLTSMPAGFTYTWPVLQNGGTIGGYAAFPAGSDIVANLSASTEVSITIIYAIE